FVRERFAQTVCPMLLRLQNSFAAMTRLGREQERTANNLANANTVGFRRDRMFVEALNERIDVEGAPASEKLTTQWADQASGSIEATGNPLDVALQGDGFFVVTDDNGAARYTRAGRFTTDAGGMLRDASGRLVAGDNGPLTLPAGGGPIIIGSDGTIEVGGAVAGKLRVVTFDDPMQLERAEGATFIAGDQNPRDVASPALLQGHIETSNVDVIAEMTEMIEHFRLFESHQKVLQTTDQVLSGVTRDLGRF
ncbi:MAG: flagellar basal-body rod protein FlgF, partial [Bacteroidota bacterium]